MCLFFCNFRDITKVMTKEELKLYIGLADMNTNWRLGIENLFPQWARRGDC